MTKLRDVCYSQCFDEHADHVFIIPIHLQLDLIQVHKIKFVEIGKKCGILYLVRKKSYIGYKNTNIIFNS